MRAICRALVLIALVTVLVIVLNMTSDESDALDCYPNEVNFDPDELIVTLNGNEIEPRAGIQNTDIIRMQTKTGYHNIKVNGEEFNLNQLLVTYQLRDSGVVITTEKENYSLTFNTENTQGTTPDPLFNVKIGDTIILPSPTFSKTGYDMVGWNSRSDSTGISLTSGEKVVDADFLQSLFTNGNEAILYPVWSAKIYQISLTTERGEVSDDRWVGDGTSYIHSYTIESEDVTLPSAVSKDRFHHFVCWEDGNGNTVTSISKGSSGDISLSAVWALTEYSMSINVNGKTVTQTCTLDSCLEDPECEEGFRFVGWFYKDQEGNEKEFTSMSQMYENMSVYAVFEPTEDDTNEMLFAAGFLVVLFLGVMVFAFRKR